MSPLPSLVPERTPRLDLPYIMPSQAQKHVTHNEAVRALDTLVHLAVAASGIDEPPAGVADGDSFIVGPAPTGAWANARTDQVASLEDGAWALRTPLTGWRAFVANSGTTVVFDGAAWIVDGEPFPERVPHLGIGTDADDTNRLAVSAPATLLTHGGSDHRLVINRASDAATASVLFQTDWSGRAEFGFTGDQNWRVKVSTDGSAWREALVVDGTSGAVSFPHGTDPDRLVLPPANAGYDASEVVGAPNLVTASLDRANTVLSANRFHVGAFFVDRPTTLLGLNAAQYVASTTAGAVLRAGVYRLGSPSGAQWSLGDLVVDCGTQPADSAGQRRFDAPEPTPLAPGWYATVIGTNGDGAKLRVARWMTPGLAFYTLHSTGETSDLRAAGATSYMLITGQGAAIEGGLPANWSVNALPMRSAGTQTLVAALPRWRAW